MWLPSGEICLILIARRRKRTLFLFVLDIKLVYRPQLVTPGCIPLLVVELVYLQRQLETDWSNTQVAESSPPVYLIFVLLPQASPGSVSLFLGLVSTTSLRCSCIRGIITGNMHYRRRHWAEVAAKRRSLHGQATICQLLEEYSPKLHLHLQGHSNFA